jgi:hypothetical protein
MLPCLGRELGARQVDAAQSGTCMRSC